MPEIDQQLWQLWRQGQQPDVQQFLAGARPLSAGQVAAVLAVDQRERWQSGEPGSRCSCIIIIPRKTAPQALAPACRLSPHIPPRVFAIEGTL
jgi:hypothetical protein